jgi:hypothetical protein
MEGPAVHFGLEVVGVELDRQIRLNSELMEKNQQLEQRIQVLEGYLRLKDIILPEAIM